MLLIYTGAHRPGVDVATAEGDIYAEYGVEVEIPDAVARALLMQAPKNWKKPDPVSTDVPAQ